MQTIDRDQLAVIRGGFGALLGAALQAAPGILNGVAGIIGASKSGGGGGGRAAAAPPAAAAAGAVGAAGAVMMPAMCSPCRGGGGGSDEPSVSVTVANGLSLGR